MSENPVCSKCGKKGVTVSMSVPGSGHDPTPPICLACFKTATKDIFESKEGEG